MAAVRSRRNQLKGLSARFGIAARQGRSRKSWDKRSAFLLFASVSLIFYVLFLLITLNGEGYLRTEQPPSGSSASSRKPDNPQQAWMLEQLQKRKENAAPAHTKHHRDSLERTAPIQTRVELAQGRSEAELLGDVESVLTKVEKCSMPDWNGHQAAYTFSFDDGSDGMVTFAPLVLNENGIRGTFFITPIFVDPPSDNPKPAQLPDKWPFVLDMYAKGHEIGGHTTSHRNFFHERNATFIENDFREAVRRLEAEIPGLNRDKYTMAYPFGASNPLSRKEASRHYLAARTIKCGMMKASDFTEEETFYMLAGCSHGKLTDVRVANKLLDTGLAAKAWTVLILHGIGSCISDRTKWADDHSIENYREGLRNLVTGEKLQCRYGYSAANPQVFEAHVKYAAKVRDEKDLWVAPMVEVVKYLRQQQSQDVKLLAVEDSMRRIIVSVSDCTGCTSKPRLPEKKLPIAIEILAKTLSVGENEVLKAYSLDERGRELPTLVTVDGNDVKILVREVDVSADTTKVTVFCCSRG